jgi:hypothetical protein
MTIHREVFPMLTDRTAQAPPTLRVRESLDAHGDLVYDVHVATYSRSLLDTLSAALSAPITFTVERNQGGE